MDNPIPAVEHERYTLSNGLTVVLVERRDTPLVGVNVNYMVGSKDEKPGRTGFAHLFEHMMFQGSKHFDDDYFKALQDVGGSVNGATNPDRTRYWELVPPALLERALWLESDRMGFLIEALTQERLDNQRSVVQNERRQSYENRPYGLVPERMAAILYPPDHPYHWTTIGSMEDISAASMDDLKAFFRAYYAPSNAALCIAGDIDTDEVTKLVEKYFGGLTPGPPVSRLDRWIPRLSGEVAAAMRDRVQLPRTYVAWHTVRMYDPDDAALDAFAQILGQGKASRLHQKLVYEAQIAQDASTFHSSQQLAGTFQMVVAPRPESSVAAVEEAAFSTLQEALAKGVTDDELERVKATTAAHYLRSMQHVGGFGGLSDRMNEYLHYLGQPDAYRWDLQRYLDLTPATVVAAARRVLGPDRAIVRVEPFPPLSSSVSAPATTVNRSTMPGPGAQRSLRLPARQRFTLANGLRIVLVEHRALPLLSCALLVRGGTAADPSHRPGLASLVAAVIPEGAAGRSSRSIAEILESLGTHLHCTAGKDGIVGALSTISAHARQALGLFADVMTHPDFPAAELERQRARRLVQLQQLQDSPQYLAAMTSQRVLYRDHPYGHPNLGTPAAIRAIGEDEVWELWRSLFSPRNATLLVVGDVTRDALEAMLAESFATWPGGPASRSPAPPAPPAATRAVYVVHRPGAVQSVVTAGLVAPPRSTPDYAALEVMNAAFGGQFVSRLNLNLREDKGFTYGARSRFDLNALAGTFTASAAVETKATAATVHEVVAEMEALIGARPLSREEVAYASGSVAHGYARRFETTNQVARELADAILSDLPDEALERFPDEALSVTAETVAALARRVIVPDRLAIVVVGDRDAVRDELEALQLGPVVDLDPDISGPPPQRSAASGSS